MILATVVASTAFAARPISARPAAADPTEAAGAALDWLGGQIITSGGALPGFQAGSIDHGLTADAVLAFAAAGRGHDEAPGLAAETLAARAGEFTTWDAVGAEYRGVRLVGPTAKLVLVFASLGRPTIDGDGTDLASELRTLMVTSGPDAGRFVDRNPHGPDSTNGFGQALAMLALALTDGGAPIESVGYLLDQQCPDGGFRLFYVDTPGCGSSASSDPDTTAMAVQALLDAERTPQVEAALSSAVGFLLARQDPGTGAFGGSGPTASINANSTGLAAQTLRAVGAHGAADQAAAWVTGSLQLSDTDSGSTPAAPHIGAIAHTATARDAALSEGIPDVELDQWRRATTQAVLALGLPRFSDTGPVAPIVPVPPPDTTTTTTTVTEPQAGPTPAVPTPDGPDPTRPSTEGTATGDAAGAAADTRADGSTSGAPAPRERATVLSAGTDAATASNTSDGNAAAARSTLASTGADPQRTATIGLVMLGAGVALSLRTRRATR